MGGSYVDAATGRFLAAELRYPTECLDCKNVRGVRQQTRHLHPAFQQAVLRRPVADAVPTGQARGFGCLAHRALDRVTQVCPAAAVQRLIPLQTEYAIVYLCDDAAWSRGRSYGDTTSPSYTDLTLSFNDFPRIFVWSVITITLL